jgi:type IV pilus assembly protein PilY1
MKPTSSRWYHPKRLGALVVLEVFLVHSLGTAYAGTVSQLPGVYITPPAVNVMFTLDDSLSMHSDVIPDLLTTLADGTNVDLGGLPDNSNDASSAVAPDIAAQRNRFNQIILGTGSARQFPDMWGHPTHTGTAYLHASYYSAFGTSAQNIAGRFLRSSDGNPLYYNPKVRYRPWPTAANDTNFMTNANPAAVNIHPSDPTNATRTINLNNSINNGGTFWPATYFVKTSVAPLRLADPASAGGATFTRVEIRPTVTSYAKRHGTGEVDNRTDCAAATTCTYEEERQNFANWLQYYRNRMLMAKGGVSAAFARQSTNLRVGFGTINSPVQLGVREFSSANRTAFYNLLYPVARSTQGTPLRTALSTTGEYFRQTSSTGPWAADPANSVLSPEYSCRRSFHILSTDGFWNGNAAPEPAGGSSNNNDDFTNTATPTPPGKDVGFAYTNDPDSKWGVFPFEDSATNTLADVAAYYWKTDLRDASNGDLANNVTPSERDPAFWQHVSTFTVGLGVSGTGRASVNGSTTVPTGLPTGHPLKAFEGRPWLSASEIREWLVSNKVDVAWPAVSANSATTGDDLIHAAMNSRGRYYSANNPTDLANGLSSALAEASDNAGDFAAVAADALQVRAGDKVYQATFSPARWYGRLYAFQTDNNGKVNNQPTDSVTTNSTQLWEASNKMPAWADRKIFTSDGRPGKGELFSWSSGLTSAQQTALGSEDVLKYLRGEDRLEVANKIGSFRDRSRYTVGGVKGGVLGDIVNSSPVKGPDGGGGYNRLPSGDPARDSYVSYREGNKLVNLRDTIFVGANDGMLHAFNLENGVERFAYVPNAVYDVPKVAGSSASKEKKLRLLATDLTNTHRFTVDGPPNVADAYVNGKWRTVLAGSNGAGARGIFALDVTNPDTVAAEGGEVFSKSNILWEFSEASNPSQATDIGYVLAYPHVVRMRDSARTWAVVTGNGFDSESGQAKLFILKLSDGSVLKEIAVGAAGTGNGLAQPNFILNANREVETIYAGDLKGNLWKFDVSSNDTSNWAAAFGSTTPLFKTASPSTGAGAVQPISVMPEITAHPRGGALVTFGTGKLFETTDTSTGTDNENRYTQSIYSIWDKPSETTGITAPRESILQQQTLTTVTGASYATTSNNVTDYDTQRGWYLDLGSENGERVNLPAQQLRRVTFVVANTPTADPCSGGGTSKLLAFDPVSGASPAFAVFDLNNDGKFDDETVGRNVRVITNGVMTQPLFQTLGAAAGERLATTSTLEFFDRGQASGGRQGGVELLKSGEATTGCEDDPTAVLATTALSDASLEQGFTRVTEKCAPPPSGPSKPRISWRQLQ